MRHLNKVRKISKPADHRRAILSNLTVSLFTHGQIKTTRAKAKALREYAEHMITLAKKGDLNSRRIVLARLRNNSLAIKNCVNFLFDKIAPIYQSVDGGYTRILRIGFRKGDCSEICLIQLLNYEGLSYQSYIKKESKAKTSEKKSETVLSDVTPQTEESKQAEPQQTIKPIRKSKKDTLAVQTVFAEKAHTENSGEPKTGSIPEAEIQTQSAESSSIDVAKDQ